MLKKQLRPSIMGLVLCCAVWACDKETAVQGAYTNGVFIVNEGPFGSGTGTVDFYNRQKGGLTADIFGVANNGAAAGNVVQSLTMAGDKALLVVNNANKVWILDADDFTFKDSISGLVLPRYAAALDNGRVAISEWGNGGVAGAVKIFDLNTKQWRKTIPTGKGAERLLRVGTTLWVVNNGGFDTDSTLVAIDLNTETVAQTLVVGTAANSLVQDATGDLWVLSGGAWGAASGHLTRLKNGSIQARYAVPQGASNLVANATKDKLFFIAANKVYVKDLSTAPATVWSDDKVAFGYLYGLGFDTKTNALYCADAKNFTTAGTVYVFDSNKQLQDSLKTGIIPSYFYFR